ncbi:MAG TPA: YciI family protein [Polyangiaceae bacterium]
MEYMLLLFADQAQFETLTPSQAGEAMAAYGAYTDALKKAGVLRGSNRLRPVQAATTVRVKSGNTEVLNGPYAETREQLGGYYLIDVPDLDAALSWAARCPGASHGIIEVRPIWPAGAS